jgi:hypothetical protein
VRVAWLSTIIAPDALYSLGRERGENRFTSTVFSGLITTCGRRNGIPAETMLGVRFGLRLRKMALCGLRKLTWTSVCTFINRKWHHIPLWQIQHADYAYSKWGCTKPRSYGRIWLLEEKSSRYKGYNATVAVDMGVQHTAQCVMAFQSTLVTLGTPGFNIQQFYIQAHRLFMCFVWIWRQTAIISLCKKLKFVSLQWSPLLFGRFPGFVRLSFW